jgi:hypothetical protein
MGRKKENPDGYLGKVFGKLKIISFSHRDSSRRMMFNCECECGGTKVSSIRNLQRGSANSCGCMTSENLSKSTRGVFGESTRNHIISTYKYNAKIKNLDFTLSDRKIIELFKGDCFYCGEPPSKKVDKKYFYGFYIYNGIDRMDSSIGYIENNCVSCCESCNYLKNNIPFEEFIEKVSKIYKNMIENMKKIGKPHIVKKY